MYFFEESGFLKHEKKKRKKEKIKPTINNQSNINKPWDTGLI